MIIKNYAQTYNFKFIHKYYSLFIIFIPLISRKINIKPVTHISEIKKDKAAPICL